MLPIEAFGNRGIIVCAQGGDLAGLPWLWADVRRLERCELPIEFWTSAPLSLSRAQERALLHLGVNLRHISEPNAANDDSLGVDALLNSGFEEAIIVPGNLLPLSGAQQLYQLLKGEPADTAVVLRNALGASPRTEKLACPLIINRAQSEGALKRLRCYDAEQLSSAGWNHRLIESWRACEGKIRDCALPSPSPEMVWVDANGTRVFQHRNAWTWPGIDLVGIHQAFSQAFELLDELALAPYSQKRLELFQEICDQRQYVYVQKHSYRLLEFLPDHTIGEGADGLERYWEISEQNDSLRLQIWGDVGMICELIQDDTAAFRGRWRLRDKQSIILFPYETL